MKKLAVVIKHYPPGDRISGVTSMAENIFKNIALYTDLHIFSECSETQADEWNKKFNYKIHPVISHEYWLAVGKKVNLINPDSVLIISGIHKSKLICPCFFKLISLLNPNSHTLFLQSVSLDKLPGYFGRKLLNKANNILCTNESLTSKLSSNLSKDVVYIPPAIDLNYIQSVKPAIKSKPMRVGFINHINYIKGADIALKAFSQMQLPDVEYIIAGSGEYENQLRQKYSNIENIRFLGYLPDPLPDLKACDIMVLPFRTSVSVLGISQTILECIAAGVPVIGSDTVAINSVLKDGVHGLIASDLKQIKLAIKNLYDDTKLRKLMINNCHELAKQFDNMNVSKKLLALI